MASTWLWRGDDSELASVQSAESQEGHSGSATVAACAGMRAGDAVIVSSLRTAISLDAYSGVWIVNAGAAQAARMSAEQRFRIWRQAGLSCVVEGSADARIYRVTVLNLEPHAIHRLVNGRSQLLTAEGWPEAPQLRRVARVAVRALYALGLEIGEAEVTLSDEGRAAIMSAWPLAADTLQGAELARQFAAKYAADIAGKQGRRLLIGADPEFALLTTEGKLAPASRFFGEGARGAAGADAMYIGRRLLYPVAELRPDPAETPAALAANVRRLLARAAARIGDQELRWVAGAMPLPGLALGGHIHISGAPLTGRLLRLLDCCAAYPLALVEDPAGRGRRPRYGALGDFRPQPHGGFEYRTLPSWLVSPAAAKAAFALALLCAREALHMPRIPAQEERFAEAYYAGDRTELAGCLDAVAEAVSATESYPSLARYIEPLFESARQGKTWDESKDIRGKWRIPSSAQ
ncbi:hypothetical protein D3P07_08010 [Paenibacillus sp. 1011MAR3C5]|uniref:putative amidoligase domain-containing protein n=1 Tax=Paenibacillus sp. 1011MAR3C5 TaxID=1675787 RepID=UPI000E6CF801|nr:hypothetical protein [Paenibacillus sp. 1011MAR3C5]RJE90150.1 hypothetical protein D3P07_08010 [Paenibacillus sp. 1011MAR3C5]